MTQPPPSQPQKSEPRLRPMARFLGEAEASGGPFALLGISPAACTDELVLSGLDRQIDRVNRHAECDTPEADEVRLALHAAAAQLLDPVVRRHLVMRFGGGGKAQPASPTAPTPTRQVAPPPHRPATPARALDATRLLEADAILTLGLFGGWNQRSLRRLVSLAHRRGLSTGQVAETLRNLSRRGARPRPATSPSRPQRAPTRQPTSRLQATPRPVLAAHHDLARNEPDPSQRLLRNAILFGFAGLIGLTAMVLGIIVATRQKPAVPAPPPPPVVAKGTNPPKVDNTPLVTKAPTPDPGDPPAKSAAKPKPPPLDPSDLAGITREINAATEALAVDPNAAVARFEQAITKLAANWPSIPKDCLIASHDAVVEFIYRCAATPEITMRAVGAVARFTGPLGAGQPGESEIVPATWSLGMLTRLGREKDITATAKSTIDTAVAAAIGQMHTAIDQSFEAGVAGALAILPQRLTPTGPNAAATALDIDAWRAWARCVEAVSAQDSAMKIRTLLAGLETLLVQGPEPNQNRSVAGVITELMTRITWRAEDDSRRWMLRWFGDSRISIADLNAVTSTLATRSAAEGIDLTMVLSTSASENTRAELRERYATVWGVQDSLARDVLITEWAKAAKEAINDSFSSSSEVEDFAMGVVLARLNDSAWWQWRGDGAEASRLVADLKSPVEQAMLVPERPKDAIAQQDLSDGAFAERYLNAKGNIKVKRDLIDQLMRATAIGPIDAEVVAGEAFTGSPPDLRTAAQEVVKKFADTAPMLNAVLERLPKIPRSTAASVLISAVVTKNLPGFRDPDWAIAARRALVERLIEVLAAESPMVRVDRLSVLLASSYRSMASPSPLPPDQRSVRIQPPAHQSAAEVWRKWRSAADAMVPSSAPPMALDQIDRRRSGRLSQARGMVQAFEAESASIAEVMGYIVCAEQPAKIEAVRLVLTSMGTDRRHATNVLEQVKVSERAITQLWLIRMQQEPAS